MTQVDTSIYGNMLRPVKSVQEYDAEAQQAESNKLGLLLQRGQYDAQQRGVADDAAYRDAVRGFGADSGANANMLRARGLGKQAMDYEKSALEAGKTSAEVANLKKTGAKTDSDLMDASLKRYRTGLDFIESPQGAVKWLQAQYQDPALSALMNSRGPFEEAIKHIPQTPAEFNQWRDKVAMGIENYSKKLQEDRKIAETERNNKAQNGIALSGQRVTMRGQDMTDSRARDFNAVQVEANNIKRSEKRDVADLTKNSQVASFDTMLGTLDRLGKHPGLSRSVGVTGAFPTMPGSDSANFQAELNTFQSQAFLPMVAQLKGMGALSDAEGKKLTAAVGALDPKMGEQAFRDSVARITADMEAARTRVAGAPRAGGASGEWGSPASKAPKAGAVDGGYRFKGGNPADKSNWEKVK